MKSELKHTIKCKDCVYLEAQAPRNGGLRMIFYCGHKNKKYIQDYHEKHKLSKYPYYVCFGGGLYGDIPTIKTAPAWCPLKRGTKNEDKNEN